MTVVIGKCKWGHDTPGLTNGTVNGTKIVPASLCAACLVSPDPEVKRNAGRVMHPIRYTAWTTKKPA